MKSVAENVYVELINPGCNVGIITTPKGAVIVDTPLLSRQAAVITGGLRTENREPVRFIVLTHPHGDHIHGTGLFDEDALVIGNRFACEYMKKYDPSEVRAWAKSWNWQNQDEVEEMASARIKLPDIVFENDLALDLGGVEIQVVPLPGHQPGVVGVFVPEVRVLITGDALFSEHHPYMGEGNLQVWLDSLEKMKALKPDFIIPGHGPVCGVEAITKQQSYMEKMIEIAKTWRPEDGEAAIPAADLDYLLAEYPLYGPEAFMRGRVVESIGVAAKPKF